jgi:hypothetical protein
MNKQFLQIISLTALTFIGFSEVNSVKADCPYKSYSECESTFLVILEKASTICENLGDKLSNQTTVETCKKPLKTWHDWCLKACTEKCVE